MPPLKLPSTSSSVESQYNLAPTVALSHSTTTTVSLMAPDFIRTFFIRSVPGFEGELKLLASLLQWWEIIICYFVSLIKINFFLLFSPRASFLAKWMSFVWVYFCNKVIFHLSYSNHPHVDEEMGELLGFTWQTKVITWTVGKFSECVTGGILPWIVATSSTFSRIYFTTLETTQP